MRTTSLPRHIRPLCRHCNRAIVTRPRGLCWTCYYTRGVRERYSPVSPYARRGVDPAKSYRPRPPCPTPARPGTPEKIDVLAYRLANGFDLFHPADGRC